MKTFSLAILALLCLVSVASAARLERLESWSRQCIEWAQSDGTLFGVCCGGACEWNGTGAPEGVVTAKTTLDTYTDRATRLVYRFRGTADTASGWYLVPALNVTPTATATATPTATASQTPTPTPTATRTATPTPTATSTPE